MPSLDLSFCHPQGAPRGFPPQLRAEPWLVLPHPHISTWGGCFLLDTFQGGWSLGGGCPSAAAAAKSLQSCLTLYDPIDSSPPGSADPGILPARILEWVAISFSKAWKWKVKVKSLSRVQLLATPWTAAHQAPQPMGFSRQEYWSRLPSPSPNLFYSTYHYLPTIKCLVFFYLSYIALLTRLVILVVLKSIIYVFHKC